MKRECPTTHMNKGILHVLFFVPQSGSVSRKGLVIVSVEGHAADSGFSGQYFIVRKNEVHAIDSRIGRVE